MPSSSYEVVNVSGRFAEIRTSRKYLDIHNLEKIRFETGWVVMSQSANNPYLWTAYLERTGE